MKYISVNYVTVNAQSIKMEVYYNIASNVMNSAVLIEINFIVKFNQLLTEGEGTVGGFRGPAAEEE